MRRLCRAIAGVFHGKKNSRSSAEARILELSSGKRIEDYYEGESAIQSGNFANVQKGRDKTTGKEVAIKVITNRWWDEHREVEIIKELQHKNIVQFHGVFLHSTTYAIVMELMATDLRAIINHAKPLGEDKEMAVIFEVLQALTYLEKKGVVHYDLKPANILLSALPEASVKITDFGLSEFVTVDVDERGSHPYHSPEVMKAALRPCQPQSDVWSVGVMALAMCLGQTPLKSIPSSDYNRLLEEKKTYPFDLAMKDCKEERSPAWWDFVKRCLVVDPAQRQRASQLITHEALNLRADLSQLRPRIDIAKNTDPEPETPDSESSASLEKRRLPPPGSARSMGI